MSGKIGFYGVGNMGQAMIQGILRANIYQTTDIVVYEHSRKVKAFAELVGIRSTPKIDQIAEECQIIIFAVKPNVLPNLLAELEEYLTPHQLLISVAAGVTLKTMETILSPIHKIIRAMPNTPALVGAGMSSLTENGSVTSQDKKQTLLIFNSFGLAEFVPEKLIDAVVGVSGSSPAYVYMFIEALADGAVLEGMSRQQAYKFASQAVLGAAKMVIETEKHPGVLKDQVTSPSGTTIEAIKTLEENKLRATVIQAVQSAAKKNQEMSQKNQ